MKGEFEVKYTNKDIMDKLEFMHNDIQSTKLHATRTNGRVTVCENVITDLKNKLNETKERVNNTTLKIAGLSVIVAFIVSIVIYILTGQVIL